MLRDGDWIIRQLGLHRAAKQIPRGWHLCRSPCCPLGAGQFGLEQSRETSEKWQEEQKENCFPPIPGTVFLPPIQFLLNVKRFSCKWGGWGTKHPKTQSLAPPHSSFQNFSCYLTHSRSKREHPGSLALLPFPLGWCSEVLLSYYPLLHSPLLIGLINLFCP